MCADCAALRVKGVRLLISITELPICCVRRMLARSQGEIAGGVILLRDGRRHNFRRRRGEHLGLEVLLQAVPEQEHGAVEIWKQREPKGLVKLHGIIIERMDDDRN